MIKKSKALHLGFSGICFIALLSGCAGADPEQAETGETRQPATTASEPQPSVEKSSSSTASETTPAPSSTTVEQAMSSTVQTSISPADYEADQLVPLHFESRVADVTTEELETKALEILNDPRGWKRAGFTFTSDPESKYSVIMAEGAEVNQLCLPLQTYGTVSCQNGTTVALNADRWRNAVEHWELGVDVYRGYLINHEVGHLLGQRHPTPRCPNKGAEAGVMEQQTAGLEGCRGNPWPREWEIDYAKQRPVVYAPLPAWGPDPVPSNREP